MAVTPVGNPYVESSDLVANYPGASEALAERIDIVGVNPFANAAARDAAIPSPVQGQMCSLNDDNKGYRYDGSEWLVFSGAGDANFTNAATGTYTDGGIDYKYLTLTGSGSVTIDRAGFADLLILSGGGGGGDGFGGGGGGGGQIYRASTYLAEGTLSVVIGAGGAADNSTGGSLGRIGGMSSLGTIGGPNVNSDALIAIGGGGGGSGNGNAWNDRGQDGGCGGGGAGQVASTIGGTGFIGGNGATSSSNQGAGGGGMGANATNRNGGAGIANSITGSSVTRGGGGGGSASGAGGSGGGGNANAAGSANTGGGGGGGGTSSNGGSGTLIIRVRTN